MNPADDATRTMRINIRQDEREGNARRRAPTWQVSGAGGSAFNAKKADYRERRSEYEHLLESIYDAVLITDLDGVILEANGRAGEFFLSDDTGLCERSVLDLLEGADESLLDAIDSNLQEHRYTLVESQCLRFDGTMFPAEIAVNRIALHDEVYLCFFIRNITVRKEAQEALESAVAKLKEHDEARAQFVSNVSHELKTPLTSILYALHNMLSGVVGPVPDRIRTYLKMLDGDARRMLATVNDILDVRKIESQTLTLDYRTLSFGALVADSIESLKLQAEQKGVELSVSVSDVPMFVRCDVPKMQRVILNIVGNATKFTPEGGEVHVEVCASSDEARNVIVQVSDTGIGIPANALPNVTRRYYTVGEQPIGSGLGLAISSEILNLHGGRMVLESPVPGETIGTRVTVFMPAAAAPRVMIVAVDTDTLSAMRTHISSRGFSVTTCNTADEAQQLVRDDKPDLLVLDMDLPFGQAHELVCAVRAQTAATKIPVMVVAGDAEPGGGTQMVGDYLLPALPKPWREDVLFDMLDDCFLGESAVARQMRAARA